MPVPDASTRSVNWPSFATEKSRSVSNRPVAVWTMLPVSVEVCSAPIPPGVSTPALVSSPFTPSPIVSRLRKVAPCALLNRLTSRDAGATAPMPIRPNRCTVASAVVPPRLGGVATDPSSCTLPMTTPLLSTVSLPVVPVIAWFDTAETDPLTVSTLSTPPSISTPLPSTEPPRKLPFSVALMS